MRDDGQFWTQGQVTPVSCGITSPSLKVARVIQIKFLRTYDWSWRATSFLHHHKAGGEFVCFVVVLLFSNNSFLEKVYFLHAGLLHGQIEVEAFSNLPSVGSNSVMSSSRVPVLTVPLYWTHHPFSSPSSNVFCRLSTQTRTNFRKLTKPSCLTH